MKAAIVSVAVLSALAAGFSGLSYFKVARAAPASSLPAATGSGALAGTPTPEVGQSLCLVTNVREHCKEGQLAWFAPERWGNDQLPITFVAAVCDFRHPIVWNNGGVACIYTDVRRNNLQAAAAPPPATSAAPSP